MPDPRPRPRLGVAAVVWRSDDVLLGERLTASGDRVWQFPGGHLEPGESVCACALRELQEETGLVAAGAVHAGFTDSQFLVDGLPYLTLYVSMEWRSGEPRVREPDRCGGWSWFHYSDLPAPLFEPVRLYLSQHTDLHAACRRPGTPAGERR